MIFEACKKYGLRFEFKEEEGSCIVHSTEVYSILAHFLMHWCSPHNIVSDLLPLIDKGMKYGTFENWKTIKGWSGYYIEEEQQFLEGIGADVVGAVFVMSDFSKFDGSDIGLVDLEMPSSDFKCIVVEWLCFLLKNTKD